MFLRGLRFIFLLILLALFSAAFLATRSEFESARAQLKIGDMPDIDLRMIAEEHWARGDADAALACLEYIVVNKMDDSAEAGKLHDEYLKQILQRDSALGRISAFGLGFLSGEVDGVDALAGSVVADFLVWGDVRDIAKESFIKDKTDKFVLAMSTLGLVTTIFPPADSPVSLLKILAKTRAISPNFKKVLVKTSEMVNLGLKNSAKKNEAIEAIQNSLLPVYDLAKNTKSWSQFSSIAKNAENADDFRAAVKLIKQSPENASKLSQTLYVLGDDSAAAFKYAVANDTKTLSKLHASLRKGASAAKILINSRTVFVKSVKNFPKAHALIVAKFSETFAVSSSSKWGVFFLLSLGISLLVISPVKIYKTVRDAGKGVGVVLVFYVITSSFLSVSAMCAAAVWGKKLADADVLTRLPSSSSLVDTIWRVKVKIEEDRFINESFSSEFFALATRIGNKSYLLFDASRAGLLWRESAKGGVYALDFSASRRGENPMSFLPDSIFVSSKYPSLAMFEIPEIFAQDTSLKILSETEFAECTRGILFKANVGAANTRVKLSFVKDFLRLEFNAGASNGDAIVDEKTSRLVGIAVEDSARALRIILPKFDVLQKISLQKQEDKTYFTEFCSATKSLQEKLSKE